MAHSRAVVVECEIDGCTRLGNAGRGWCWTHYDRWRRLGDPLKLGPRGERGDIIKNPLERFWSKVEKTPGCWFWRGKSRGRGGYGAFYWQGTNTTAHRVSYTLANGPIPEGLVIDHLCCEPSCVNPDHLEAVTVEENSRRAAVTRKREVCGTGHAMTGENVVTRKDGARYCRECTRIAQRRRRAGYAAERRMLAALAQLPAGFISGNPVIDELIEATNRMFDVRYEHSEWTRVLGT